MKKKKKKSLTEWLKEIRKKGKFNPLNMFLLIILLCPVALAYTQNDTNYVHTFVAPNMGQMVNNETTNVDTSQGQVFLAESNDSSTTVCYGLLCRIRQVLEEQEIVTYSGATYTRPPAEEVIEPIEAILRTADINFYFISTLLLLIMGLFILRKNELTQTLIFSSFNLTYILFMYLFFTLTNFWEFIFGFFTLIPLFIIDGVDIEEKRKENYILVSLIPLGIGTFLFNISKIATESQLTFWTIFSEGFVSFYIANLHPFFEFFFTPIGVIFLVVGGFLALGLIIRAVFVRRLQRETEKIIYNSFK